MSGLERPVPSTRSAVPQQSARHPVYFARDPQDIRLSVSAVVWRALGSRELLLQQRSDNGHWGLPGGHVEPGESVLDAVLREVAEETGWQIEVRRLVGVYSDPARQVVDIGHLRVHQVNLCFEAHALEQGAATTPDETLAVGFHPVGELPRPFVPIHELRIEDAMRGEGGQPALR